MRSNLLLVCLVVGAHAACAAQDTLSISNISTWRPAWRFAQGDDTTWAEPNFDDSAWEPRRETILNPGIVDSTGWSGIGWFRTTFVVDSSVVRKPIAYLVSLHGAGELYLDGRLIDHFGRPGPTLSAEESLRLSGVHPGQGTFPLFAPGIHHLAFRVSNIFLSSEGETEYGFHMEVGPSRQLAKELADRARIHAGKTFFLSGIAGVLALIYLLLFAFQPKQIKHLLFGLLSGLAAVAIYADLHSKLVTDPEQYVWWRRYMEIAGVAGWVVGVRLVGVSFFKETWKLFNVLLTLAALVALYVYFDPIGGFWSLVVLSVLSVLELIRRIGLAVFLSRPGAWLMAIGLFLLVIGGLHDYAVRQEWIRAAFGLRDLFHFGLVGFLTLMALFLGTEFARANRTLELKVLQVHQEAEKALQEEKVNQGMRIERIQAEFDNRRKEFEQMKSREVDAIRKTLTVSEEHLKGLKDRLIAAEAKASLGKLSTGIAHDVHSVLGGIDKLTSLSQDLTTELERAESGSGQGKSAEMLQQLEKNLGRIREETALASGIVDDILEHGSESDQSTQAVDVNALIDRYLNLAMHASRGEFPNLDLTVERVLDDRVGTLAIRPVKLGRALMAIFRNAVESVSEHAAEAGEDYQPTITVSTQRLEHAVLIRIRDNGPGVAQDLRDRIFEPFYSTSREKSGLGLSIAQQMIVDQMSGTFGLEHFKEQGAGFYITLPLAEPQIEEDEEPASE